MVLRPIIVVNGLQLTDAELIRIQDIYIHFRQIEERISIDTLDALKRKFETADVDGSGQLELEEFKQLLKSQLNIPPGKVSLELNLNIGKVIWVFLYN